MDFIERFTMIMQILDIKQNNFAEMLNVSPQAISKIINKKSKPSMDTIINLCKICEKNGIEIKWLMTGEETNQSPGAEKILIENYRRADERGKETILDTAKREAERNSQQETLSTSRTG